MSINSKFLYLVILSCLIFQISKFYSFYSEYSAWQYVDWIINYQGGFVRRGLVGESLFQLHRLTNIDLDLVFSLCNIYNACTYSNSALFYLTHVIIHKNENIMKYSVHKIIV